MNFSLLTDWNIFYFELMFRLIHLIVILPQVKMHQWWFSLMQPTAPPALERRLTLCQLSSERTDRDRTTSQFGLQNKAGRHQQLIN